MAGARYGDNTYLPLVPRGLVNIYYEYSLLRTIVPRQFVNVITACCTKRRAERPVWIVEHLLTSYGSASQALLTSP